MSLDKLGGGTTSRGNQGYTNVHDLHSSETLKEILKELRILNLYMREMTDLTFTEEDLKT